MKVSFSSIFLLLMNSLRVVICTFEENKFVAIPYQVCFGSYYIHLNLGQPSQNLFHAIDQEREFTWTANTFYSREKSNSVKVLKETNLRFRHLDMFGSILEEHLTLTSNNQIDEFPFYVINSTRGFNSRVGGIGFSYKFRDTHYSIIHRLKEAKQIDNLAYSFVSLTKDNGTFYLGGVPDDSIVNKTQSSCKVTNQHSNWDCDLSFVFFGDISYVYDNIYYNNHEYAFFQVADKRILAPEAFIDYLNNNYFHSYIRNDKCILSISMNKVFECNCNIINALPKIHFIFDSKAYSFKASELFEESGPQCTFLIASNHIRDKNWLFGTVFLSKFISLYDYNKSTVTFYSNNEIETIDLDKLFPWKKLLRWSIYLIGIIIILILVRYLYVRNKQRQKRKIDFNISGDYIQIK